MGLRLALTVAAGVAALAYHAYWGMSVTGLQNPVFWGVYITTFVFWDGIAHAGTLISAILFINLGMGFERYVIVTTGLAHAFPPLLIPALHMKQAPVARAQG